ncbi:osmoprotectant transport system substrate-binding protein [Microlunatus sagamiharensis]|uniref:Osmoprotectant transport system substrate-binding protein n=1 Tax=Microlunatus sagamiharensis TaxID=546874 RepID=A0A1H2N1Z7_9ACTN|nr:ABC transporter substrate-binding protein [Microlunatus sagamiharensis]SDU99354.1 osmoprotectant transport system substrate-binding protein [Microlunatus sagamiharensis]
MTIKRSLAALGLTITTLVLAACGGGSADPLASSAPPSASAGGTNTPIVVGSADFTESQVLGEIYAQALTAKGLQASTKPNIGSREVYLKALQDSSIQIVPEYTGNLLLYVDQNATATTQEELADALPSALPSGLKIGEISAAADQDVYVVTKEFSAQNNLTSLADLKNFSQDMVLGGPSTLETRAYGVPGLKGVYGATLKQFKPYESSAVRAKDLNDGKIQLGEFFTTESVIADNGYVALADPQSMILPQNVVPLMQGAVADNAQVKAALDPVQAALTTDDLTALNKQVDVDKMDPNQVAASWLKSKGLA